MFVLFQNTGFFNEMDHNPDGEELDCDYVLCSSPLQSRPDHNYLVQDKFIVVQHLEPKVVAQKIKEIMEKKWTKNS